MNVLVCIKRVPATGERISITADGQDVDTRYLGFTISPHEECAVEEAVRLVEAFGGTSTVMTLGPEAAMEQLRDAMAIGIERAELLETDGAEWDPMATAAALTAAIRAREDVEGPYDLVLFGNESADSADFQVGVRVAVALDRPCVTGVKAMEVSEGQLTLRRERGRGWEVLQAPLPAVVTVREGLNLPRYPSVPGRLRARKKEIARTSPALITGGPVKLFLRPAPELERSVEILGRGPEAVPAVVAVLRQLGLVG